MNNQKVLVPDYYNDFKCIAGECEDTCCSGWKIYVDKSTYDFYKEVKGNRLSELFKNNIHINENHTGTSDYGIIDVRENGDCVFLSGDRLCRIYSDLGETNMCTTCRDFPRYYNYTDKVIEKSLSLSCPEACRQILFRNNQIEFYENNEHIEEITIQGSIDTINPINDSEKFFWEIRIFTIRVLQTRALSIEERMVALGLFFYDIENKEDRNIKDIIEEHTNYIENNKYSKIFEDLKSTESQIRMQLLFIIRICGTVLNRVSGPGYFDDFKNIVIGFGLDGSKSHEEFKDTYVNVKNGIYSEFIIENPNLYENYLVNYVFQTLFPKTDISLFDIYLNLVLNFSILKFNIIGLHAFYNSKIRREKIVHLVSNFDRIIQHNNDIVRILNKFAHENNFNNIDNILMLIGN